MLLWALLPLHALAELGPRPLRTVWGRCWARYSCVRCPPSLRHDPGSQAVRLDGRPFSKAPTPRKGAPRALSVWCGGHPVFMHPFHRRLAHGFFSVASEK